MKISRLNSINYYVWSQGIFWAILGLIWANQVATPDPVAVFGALLSMLLLAGLLLWTGKILAQMTINNVSRPKEKESTTDRIQSPYYQINRY